MVGLFISLLCYALIFIFLVLFESLLIEDDVYTR